MSRSWAMPHRDTLLIAPIRQFVVRHLRGVSVDPFARNCTLATYTNDLDPTTKAESHEDAAAWMLKLTRDGVRADTVIFDPPYSPRQISDCYKGIGRAVRQCDTQSARFYRECREAIRKLIAPGATVLSFGWQSCGMGKGFDIVELLLVAHGGAHNDTICMAEVPHAIA